MGVRVEKLGSWVPKGYKYRSSPEWLRADVVTTEAAVSLECRLLQVPKSLLQKQNEGWHHRLKTESPCHDRASLSMLSNQEIHEEASLFA